ncbi:hypothetical protein SOPP22_16275 [Shewanella sp. OPT22]|nr:hypothetical protein SOPP22_16275 [Shewanella sp. OPT22]
MDGKIRIFMKFIEYFVLTFLWCGVAISPTLLGGIIGAVVGNSNGLLVETMSIGAALGFGFGVNWAEQIRITIGLSVFLGRLLGAKD